MMVSALAAPSVRSLSRLTRPGSAAAGEGAAYFSYRIPHAKTVFEGDLPSPQKK